jgi:hypothetical protein
MTTTASYSPNAAKALGFLKSNQNDIDIYVEDSGNPNMWVKLLRKSIPDKYRLDSVSVLGGRRNVIEACRVNQNEARPCLYIIDADFDLLLEKPKPRLRFLYRLRAYSVENYLLNESSLEEVATTFSPRVSKADARRVIDFPGWLAENRACLERVFLAYAVSHLMACAQPTVSYSVHRLLAEGSQRNRICPSRVRGRVREIFARLEADYGRHSLCRSISLVRRRQRELEILAYVSCKDYVLPQMYSIMKQEFRLNVSIEVFKTLLATGCPERIDPYLARRLRKILSD